MCVLLLLLLFSDISDHLSNFLLIKDTVKKTKQTRPKIRIFSNKNHLQFSEKLNQIDWNEKLYIHTDIDTAYNSFIQEIKLKYDKCYPLVTLSRRGGKDKPWFSESLKKCCRKKDKLYKKWIRSSNSKDYENYINYRRTYELILKESEKNHFDTIFNRI